MARFSSTDEILEASRRVVEAGYQAVEAYTPFPVEDLNEALGRKPTRLPWIVLAGGLGGAALGFLMQVWMNGIDYPINYGGRPPVSWPAFIPATFEMGILLASFSAVIGMLALNGLPQPYHPVFNVPAFRECSRDGFFLVIETADPKFDERGTREFLEGLNPMGVYEVAR